jgi:Domain of unknown function (DUF4304)
MSAHREQMLAALKERLVPFLREKGFVGSFPHFRRELKGRIDFLDVQFAREGGRFCLNIGQTGPDGLKDPAWPDLTLAETTTGHLQHRSRVHWGFFLKQWFDFGPRSYDRPKPVKLPAHYEGIAARAVRALEKDGERWFGKEPALRS